MPHSANQPGHAPSDKADAPHDGQAPAQGNPVGEQPPTTPRNNNGKKKAAKGKSATGTKKKTKATPSLSKRRYITVLNRDRPMAWLVLLALIVLTAIPVYSYLHADKTLSEDQSKVLSLAQETWQHRHMLYQGEVTLESMVPILNDQPKLSRPPGDVWLYQLSFSSLDPMSATHTQMLEQMRLLSALFGLLTIGAIFWAGYSIGGLKTAAFSGLIALSCPVFTFYARQGTPEVPLLGFQAIAVASAMWALRPLRPPPSVTRQSLGWIICGFSLGSSILIGGLSALIMATLPILVMSIMCPGRISHLLGLVASLCIAGLMVMPWAMYVHNQDTYIWEVWVADLWPTQIKSFAATSQSLYERSIQVPLLVLPWTIWLVGSLAQPFSASSRGVRRRVFIGWAWLLTVGVLAVIGLSAAGIGGSLIMLPASALLIGQCLRLYSDRSAEGRHARVWRHTRWAHMVFYAVASVTIPAAMLFQDSLVQRGFFDSPLVAPMPWYFWLGLAISLILITLMSMRYALRHYPGKATICWSIWSVVLVSVMLIPVSRGPRMNSTLATPATDVPAESVTIP